MPRAEHLLRLYQLLSELKGHLGGFRRLDSADGRMDWPQRGVYFFFELGEERNTTDLRVVRVGTHALKPESKATLWQRLSQHRGVVRSGAGNHRGSIFRLIVGASIIKRDGLSIPSWGVAADAGAAARKLGLSREALKDAEFPVEIEVSKHIRSMPFLWLEVDDGPGPNSLRSVVERNAIALLSNAGKDPLDASSPNWLGNLCNRNKVRRSGLWNSDYVDSKYEPGFLDTLATLVSRI